MGCAWFVATLKETAAEVDELGAVGDTCTAAVVPVADPELTPFCDEETTLEDSAAEDVPSLCPEEAPPTLPVVAAEADNTGLDAAETVEDGGELMLMFLIVN